MNTQRIANLSEHMDIRAGAGVNTAAALSSGINYHHRPKFTFNQIWQWSLRAVLCGILLLYSGIMSIAAERTMMVNQKIFDQVLAAALAKDKPQITRFAKAGQLDALDTQGLSTLLHLVMQNRLDAAQILLDAGAGVDAFEPELSKNVIDQTAFLYAGAAGNNAALKMLIKAGAKTDIYNYYGGTALIPAAERGHVETVRLLLEQSSVDVNHVNKLGWTALMEAVVLSNGGADQQQIVALLLKHGADKSIPDKDGITALQHAQAKGFNEIADLLKSQ